MALEHRSPSSPIPARATLEIVRDEPADVPGIRPQPHKALIGAFAVLSALYVVSRLYGLMALPIFFDEAHYTLSALLIGRDPLHTSPFIEVAYWGVPPLFTWIAAPLTRLIADPLLAGRLAAAGIGALGLLAVWRCGRAVAVRSTALIALALYVFSPFVLLYTRMAMVDGLLAVIGAFALLAAMRLAGKPSVRAALLLGLCCAAAIFTKIFGPLDLALAGIAIVAAPAASRRRVMRLASLSTIIGCTAFLVLLVAPGGQSLVLVAEQQQGGATSFVTRVAAQAILIGQSYGLYVTPPVLLLAIVGAFYARRNPEERVLLMWAVLAWLPFLVIHLAPRYLLGGAIPLMLLAARGTVELARTARRRHSLGGTIARRLIVGALVALAIGAYLWEDSLLILSPAHAALVSSDRQQYIGGWPSGYALETALTDLHRLANGETVTLIAPLQNPPADDLAILAGGDPQIHLVFRDFATLQSPAALRHFGTRAFVVVCRPVGQQLDTRRAGLHLALAEPNVDGIGGVYLYSSNSKPPHSRIG